MTTNMGLIDRGLQLILAAALLFFTMGTASGLFFWLILAMAAVFILTAIVGICPLYRLIGLKTCRDCE